MRRPGTSHSAERSAGHTSTTTAYSTLEEPVTSRRWLVLWTAWGFAGIAWASPTVTAAQDTRFRPGPERRSDHQRRSGVDRLLVHGASSHPHAASRQARGPEPGLPARVRAVEPLLAEPGVDTDGPLSSPAQGHEQRSPAAGRQDRGRGGARPSSSWQQRQRMIARFDQAPTLPRLLADRGYISFQAGKWWGGNFRRGGFTAGMSHGDSARGGRHGDEGLQIGRTTMKPVIDFIDEAAAAHKPFFLWYAPMMPHSPHNPPAAPRAIPGPGPFARGGKVLGHVHLVR